MLQSIEFVEELEVQRASLGDGGIVGVEGELSGEWRRRTEPA